MTGDKTKFLSLTTYEGGSVTFGDNKKGNIVAMGKVGKSPLHSIENAQQEYHPFSSAKIGRLKGGIGH